MPEDHTQNISTDSVSQTMQSSASAGGDEETLQQQIETLKKLAEENLRGWQRAKADYINFRNEQEKHQKELARFASIGAVMQMIPLSENLRKAFTHIPDQIKDSPWVKGIEQVHKQLKDTLKSLGVEEQPTSVGRAFDPQFHQAVGQEYVDSQQEDMVTQEISAAYTFHGKVLIPARVIVNKKPESGAKNESGIRNQE